MIALPGLRHLAFKPDPLDGHTVNAAGRAEHQTWARLLTDRQAGALQRVLAERAEYGNYTGGDQTDGDRDRAAEDLFRSLDESGHMRADRAEAAMGLYGMLRGGKGGVRPGKAPTATAARRDRPKDLPELDLPVPDAMMEEYMEFWEKTGRQVDQERQADPRKRKVAPSEAFFWKKGKNTRTFGDKERKDLFLGKYRYIMEWDGLQGDIEIYDKHRNHLGSRDPLTFRWTKGPKGHRIRKGMLDDGPTYG